jgi:hypothetical protein
VNVSEIIATLPDSILEELAIETRADRYVKKLHAALLFKLLLHCILSYKDNSLRRMESAYESIVFKLLYKTDIKEGIGFSSISDRLRTISSLYFEKLYTHCVQVYGSMTEEETAKITRFDSTIVSLSTQLLKVGFQYARGDAKQLKQLKFTVGLSEIPVCVKFFTEQRYNSENVALRESIIMHNPANKDSIRVFDRGVTARKTYDLLCEQTIPFISRIIPSAKVEEQASNQLSTPITSGTLLITKDCAVKLFEEGGKKTKHTFRLIYATKTSDQTPIHFITNINDLSVENVAQLYKRRWEIEVFFKFIKQELNFSHLLNRSENGIKVVLYATLIAAILLMVYKKKNNIKGYKILKQKFVQELEMDITRDIVILCNGNVELFDQKFGRPPN